MSRAFQIAMDSAQEVGTGSTSTATGLGVAVFDDSGVNPTLEYTIEVRGLDWGPFTSNPAQTAPLPDNVVDAHFHQAVTGVNGPVRFGWKTHDLDDFAAGNQHLEGAVPVATVHGVWETTDTVSIAGFVASFSSVALGNPTDMYANIHSSAFPGGDIRGQLICIATDSGETVNGTAGRDILPGLGGNDTVLGLGGDDTLDGGAGDDTVNGGTDNDTMAGGLGNDFLFVDAALDVVNEAAGGGADRVLASASYSLTAGSSIETFSTTNNAGVTALDLTGNELANTIFGNAGNNVINGGGGNDSLNGFGGDDQYVVDSSLDVVNESGAGIDTVSASVSYALKTGSAVETLMTTDAAGTGAINLTGNDLVNSILGNAGNNTLDGKGGADFLTGLGGNDFYVVDDAAETVQENPGGGSDRVVASVSYALAAGVDVEIFSTTNNAGTTAINLTGNELANTIFGNAGNNSLTGGGAADILTGFGGNDFYFVDNAGDIVNESSSGGADRVLTSVSYALKAMSQVEMFTTTNNGGLTSIALTGNELANSIFGNAGNNLINGGAGNDTMIGFAGLDNFRFSTALNASTNVDRITDFDYLDDTIELDDAIFTALTPGALPAGAFNIGASASDADDRIIYNSTTGALIYDSNGNLGGGATQFAMLAASLIINDADFVVV